MFSSPISCSCRVAILGGDGTPPAAVRLASQSSVLHQHSVGRSEYPWWSMPGWQPRRAQLAQVFALAPAQADELDCCRPVRAAGGSCHVPWHVEPVSSVLASPHVAARARQRRTSNLHITRMHVPRRRDSPPHARCCCDFQPAGGMTLLHSCRSRNTLPCAAQQAAAA